jgi:hypothetical protein
MRLEGLGKLKNKIQLSGRDSNSRYSGLQHDASTKAFGSCVLEGATLIIC